MHIQQGMYGYWNAAWGAPVTQAGASSVAWAGAGGDAGGSSSTESAQGGGDYYSTPQAGGGNLLMQALAQALESLGLTLSSDTSGSQAPAASAANSTSSSTAASTGSAGSAAAATSAAAPPASSGSGCSPQVRSIAGDIRHLMHALFEDVWAENLLAPSSGATGSSATTASSTPSGSFTSGLAALVSQIQSGSAPANLQQAFDSLVANLQQPSGAVPDPISQGASEASAPALLLQFLTNLQTNLGLGYGGSASVPAQSATTGLTVNTLA